MDHEQVNVIVTEGEKIDDRWRVEIRCMDESWKVDLPDPMLPEAKERLRWSVEEHASDHPFEVSKCQASFRELHSSGTVLYETLGLGGSRLGYLIANKRVLFDIVEGNSRSDFHQLHWEVLEDLSYWKNEEAKDKVPASVVVRRVFRSRALRDELPSMAFRMLYVVARPWNDKAKYIDHRLITRSLVKTLDAASPDSVRVALEVVRPGTLPALREHLLKSRRPTGESAYNLLHLDMHGAVAVSNDGEEEYEFEFLSPESEGAPAPVKATLLARLMKQYKIRVVVLNTCESANARGKASANLAKLFLRHGIRTVVAMSYKLTTTGAEVFFNTFYHTLFANGLHYAEAAAAGRQALKSQNQRRARYGLMLSVHDWIVPVCYIDLNQTASTLFWTRDGHMFFYHPFTKNLPMILSHDGTKAETGAPVQAAGPTTFAEVGQVDSSPAIIGRDLELLQLEYKLISAPNIVLMLSGPSGAGKTAFVATLPYWWIRTRFASRVVYISCISDNFDAILDEWVAFSSDPSQTPVEGLPWIYIIDHLDEDVVHSAGEEPSPIQTRLTEALGRLYCPHAKFVFVTRLRKRLFETTPPVKLLVEQSYKVDELRLNGLSHTEASELGAEVLARQHGSESGVTLEQVPYLRRLYDRVCYLPEGIKWLLHHCHPYDQSLSVQDVLGRLDSAELTLHTWPSVSIVLEALIGPPGNLGIDIAFFSMFAGSSRPCPSPGHWREYLYFLSLYEHRILFPDLQVSPDDLGHIRRILEQTLDFSGNTGILDSEAQLRAVVIQRAWTTELIKIAYQLERLGLVRIADENSAMLHWMHPGLSITLRRFFRLPQFTAAGGAADRAFAYAMVMKHFDHEDEDMSLPTDTEVVSQTQIDSTRTVKLGRRTQLIRRGLQNYVRAAKLGLSILRYSSREPGPLPFNYFASYLIDVMEAINVSKYEIEVNVLMKVAKSTLNDFFTALATGTSIDIKDVETSMALLISIGKMNVGGDEGHVMELWELIGRGARLCDVPGLSIGAQMTLWAIQSRPGPLLQGQQPTSSPNQVLEPYVRLQAAKEEFRRACRFPNHVDRPDDWLYESFLAYRAQWIEYEQSDPPLQRLNAAALLEERILRADVSEASQTHLRSMLSAYARFIAHENENEQAERCFTIEQLRLERRLAEAKEKAYEGLEDAMRSGDQQGEYDFRRYTLEVHDDMPLLEAQSHLAHLRRLEGELSQHQTVPRAFHMCLCWYPAVQAELAVARSDPAGVIQHSLEAVLHAVFSCRTWFHAQKALCGLQSRTNLVSETTVVFLRLCLKYEFAECPDSVSLYNILTYVFKPHVQESACATGYIWTYDIEAMHDISQMLDVPFEGVLERLFRVYAAAMSDLVSPDAQLAPAVETRLSHLREMIDTEERLIFAAGATPEASERDQEMLHNLATRFNENNMNKWNRHKLQVLSDSLASEPCEPPPRLAACAVLRDTDTFLWSDTSVGITIYHPHHHSLSGGAVRRMGEEDGRHLRIMVRHEVGILD
ncbi:hypothetical protein B0J13DRAFT_632851 [Dactylonectria estremocensis]|uniref:CHAT domain-containing protein n=1 Tax=Dactylonectria estremocensis TaxID=1079267 RepID=A0A9P9FH77_9HYPO|nr:hypothetical protein B0J13DRAFT_632851 [Dactylonectria estremocensis]